MPDVTLINTAGAVVFGDVMHFVDEGKTIVMESSGLTGVEEVVVYNSEGEPDYEKDEPIKFTATHKNIIVNGAKRFGLVKSATSGVVKVKISRRV